MPDRAEEFVKEWIAVNIQAEPYVYEEWTKDPRPKEFAIQCISDAEAAGISEKEIGAAFPNLAKTMAYAIDVSADREVIRLAAKDDYVG